MTHRAIPSTELSDAGLSTAFTWSDRKSLRGPCPKCGGTRRFVLFVDKEYPSWWGFCDICEVRGWLDQIMPNLQARSSDNPPQVETQPDRPDLNRNLLQMYREGRSWEKCHANLGDKARAWWTSQGIPPEWQDFWQLGYLEEKQFYADGKGHISPAYTIPKFGLTWLPMNTDYRLINHPKKGGKYRPRFGLAPAPFLSDPNEARFFRLPLLIVEGSKKAMVSALHQTRYPSVIGVPSCNSWAGVERLAVMAEEVLVVFDPRADVWAQRLTAEIGEKAKYLVLPSKIDDAFLTQGLTDALFQDVAKWAKRSNT